MIESLVLTNWKLSTIYLFYIYNKEVINTIAALLLQQQRRRGAQGAAVT